MSIFDKYGEFFGDPRHGTVYFFGTIVFCFLLLTLLFILYICLCRNGGGWKRPLLPMRTDPSTMTCIPMNDECAHCPSEARLDKTQSTSACRLNNFRPADTRCQLEALAVASDDLRNVDFAKRLSLQSQKRKLQPTGSDPGSKKTQKNYDEPRVKAVDGGPPGECYSHSKYEPLILSSQSIAKARLKAPSPEPVPTQAQQLTPVNALPISDLSETKHKKKEILPLKVYSNLVT